MSNRALERFPELVAKYTPRFEKLGLEKVTLGRENGDGPGGSYWQGSETLFMKALNPKVDPHLVSPHVRLQGTYSGLPGCCGVAVISLVWALANGGLKPLVLYRPMHELLLEIVDKFNWSRVVATSTEEVHGDILKDLGYKEDWDFKNRRSPNRVHFWSKLL